MISVGVTVSVSFPWLVPKKGFTTWPRLRGRCNLNPCTGRSRVTPVSQHPRDRREVRIAAVFGFVLAAASIGSVGVTGPAGAVLVTQALRWWAVAPRGIRIFMVLSVPVAVSGLIWTLGMLALVSDCTEISPCHGTRDVLLLLVGAAMVTAVAWFVPHGLTRLVEPVERPPGHR